MACTRHGVLQVHMFENPYHRRQLRAWGLTPETAFTCAFM